MERTKKIVLEAPKGYHFVVSQEDCSGLKIRLIPTVATEYSGNYTDPPIPEGWEYVEGDWNNGFTIQDSKGNQFVWVPVGFLDPNGTLDGSSCSEKFGRRNYQDDEFSINQFHEELEEELQESVQKYGGFYISRYNISRSKTGEAKSVKGAMPWTNINWFDAMEVAKTFGDGVYVTSHLPFGAEYDSVLEWFIKSGKRSKEEIANDSTQWGNFRNTRNAPWQIVKTGTREEWFTNNICDLAGNVAEWTQERNNSSFRIPRGGRFSNYGEGYPVAYRGCILPLKNNVSTGFRATLYIK